MSPVAQLYPLLLTLVCGFMYS